MSERVDDLPTQPVPVRQTHLVVYEDKKTVEHACVEQFFAVRRAPEEADKRHEPTEDECGFQGDATGGDGPVWFVELVFLYIESLIGEIKCEDLKPEPEEDMRNSRERSKRGRSCCQTCLVNRRERVFNDDVVKITIE